MTTITIDGNSICGNNICIYGIGGTGYIAVNQQATDPSGQLNSLIISADSAGNMTMIKPNGFVAKFASNNTASRTYTFEDADDTITMNSQAQALTNKTLDDASNNVVANSMRSGGSAIDFSSSPAPGIGQILIATSTSTATWQQLPLNYFGTPNLGNVVISTNTTLTGDSYYANLTINTGISLNTGGYRIFVSGTLTLSGTSIISRDGNNGTNGDSGTAAGAAIAAGSIGGGTVGGAGGAAGVAGGAGGAPTGGTSVGGGGGAGGRGNVNVVLAGNGGTISVPTAANGGPQVLRDVSRGISGRHLGAAILSGGTGGGGGGGGSTGATRNGGGGGSGAGVIIIAANIITGTGTITANGGNGGNGSTTGGTTNGGAGGGGGGGTVLLVNNQLTGGFTIAQVFVNGGSGGTASAGGATGTNGNVGTIVLL
jgi:hypothetical protein